jgi:protein phosphatase
VPFDPAGLFVVADGMGGQLAGEEASRLAVQIIPRELRGRLRPDDDEPSIREAIKGAVAAANREILAQSNLVTELTNMGTTVVLLLIRQGRAYVAGIGDSRVYRLRGGRLEQLTRDHSLAKALEEAGTIAADEVESHRFKHVLYLYLGSPDAREGPEDVRVVEVRPGDQFLLASDGMTGSVRDEQIIELLQGHADPQQAAQALVDRALANQSKDNVTCVVIHAL